MKSVRCLVTQDDGSQQVACRLFLEQGIVVADPSESPTARMILGRNIVGPEGWIDSSAGVTFLERLAANYSGSYLRCTRYEEE